MNTNEVKIARAYEAVCLESLRTLKAAFSVLTFVGLSSCGKTYNNADIYNHQSHTESCDVVLNQVNFKDKTIRINDKVSPLRAVTMININDHEVLFLNGLPFLFEYEGSNNELLKLTSVLKNNTSIPTDCKMVLVKE